MPKGTKRTFVTRHTDCSEEVKVAQYNNKW